MWFSFSNIATFVQEQFESRKNNPMDLSKLNCWVRLASGVDDGLILYSNPDFKLFTGAGDTNIPSIYGSAASSGTIGVDWNGKTVNSSGEQQFGYPKPNITSIEIDEGSGKGLSRKATFTITAYTEAQLNVVTKYFLEPGFTVFLEWGWNTASSLKGYNSNLSVDYVTVNQFYEKVRERRATTNGTYDSYLGFITGGKISLSQNFWNVEVNLTGFTELPAYLNVTDNFKKENEGITYGLLFNSIESEIDVGKRRFKTMFNQLPSTRRTQLVKNLEIDADSNDLVNFINFDEAIKDKINSLSDGWLFNIFEESVVLSDGSGNTKRVDIPTGTKVVGDEKFIRFKLLMKIISQFGSSYKMGDTDVNFIINTDTTIISAFKNIFSIDKSRLFIPNPNSPNFSLLKASEATGSIENFISEGNGVDNSVVSDKTTVIFPHNKPIINGAVDGVKIEYTDNKDGVMGFNKDAYNWGYLDNLYVNFDYVNSIIDTPNFSLKDALYQILNGISAAANGLWNFQIEEVPSSTNKGVVVLKIIDLNLTPKLKPEEDKIYVFDIYGYNSIFMDANFDMDIGGAMMNQIIGKRLSASSNQSSPSPTGKLFASGSIDKVLNKINYEPPTYKIEENSTSDDVAPDEEEIRKQNIELFFQKVGWYPKVGIYGAGSINADNFVEVGLYKSIYDDREAFTSIKIESDTKNEIENKNMNVSIPLPIKFSFTVHGISGIKRGDKFSVKGLPKQYSRENGFFQVTSLKHIIENMMWKTTIEGEFRTIKSEIKSEI
jgi:hypothetical protein